MISIRQLDKYFNKGKTNEIHVIDNTSLDFPEVGLVALTGPSGCGKTTLLNVIGGLDGFASGVIDIDGETITRYVPGKIDPLRNRAIGYIFQNYNLITDKTVYENVVAALNIAGLFDPKKIEERVNYVLKSVGMYNYRKRNVLALSGGQQQRVAIARAIAKNPKVVLADEPTGNLDANNTFEIMGIIRKISRTRLVILVSHARELVEFYADRIIEIADGRVVRDTVNTGNRTLEHVDDRNVYLLDLEKETGEAPVPVAYYHGGKPPAGLSLKLVHFNDTVYVRAEGPVKVKYLTEDTEIRLLEEHYRKPETEDVEKSSFNLDALGNVEREPGRGSFIRFRDTLLAGFKKIFGQRKFFRRLFLFAYFIISALTVYELASFGNLTRVEPADFMNIGKNLVDVTVQTGMNYQDVTDLVAGTAAEAVSPYIDAQYVSFRIENYYQGSGPRTQSTSLTVFPVPVSQLGDYDLAEGVLPANNQEAAVDVWIADQILAVKSTKDLGVDTYAELLGATIALDYYGTGSHALTIVGVVVSEAPVVVVTDANILFFADALESNAVVAHGSAVGLYELVEGVDIADDGQILASVNAGYDLGDETIVSGTHCVVVGLYDGSFPYQLVLYDALALILTIEARLSYGMNGRLLFYADDVALATAEIAAEGYVAEDAYTTARTAYVAQSRAAVAGRITTILVTLGGIVVYIFFMTRSSMLGRIKEIGIYRSIGATKNDIMKIFVAEIVAFTAIGSLPGYLLMTYVVNQLEKTLGAITPMFYLPLPLFLGGILAIFAVNIVFGMIPIFALLHKTPSEINAKYDI